MRPKKRRLPVPFRSALEILLDDDNYPEVTEDELKKCEFGGVVWGSGGPDMIKFAL